MPKMSKKVVAHMYANNKTNRTICGKDVKTDSAHFSSPICENCSKAVRQAIQLSNLLGTTISWQHQH